MKYDLLDTIPAVEEKARQLRHAGQWTSLVQLLDSLPSPGVYASPVLRLFRAEAALRLAEAHHAVELTNTIIAENGEIPSWLRAKALLIRSAASRLRGFPDKALEDAFTALAILETDSSPVELLIESHKQVGIVLGMAGELDRAIQHLEKAHRLCAKSADLELLAVVEQDLGTALARLGQLSEAQVHFTYAKAACRKVGHTAEFSGILDNIGRLHYLLGEYDLSLNALQEALQLARDSQARRTEAMVLVNIGDTLQAMGLPEKALESYRMALDSGEQALEPRLFCCANTGIGSVYIALKDFKKARFFLKQASYEAERLKLKYELAVAMLNHGILACTEYAYGKASEALEKSVMLLESIGSPEPLVKAYLYLSLALLHTKRWAKLNESLRMLTKLVHGFDLESRLVREAKAVPAVISYAASKRIGDKLFCLVKGDLEGKREPPSDTRAEADATPATSAYPKVEVYSLGRSEVLVAGRKVSDAEWESQKAKELFLYLLCHRSGKRREELLEVLWPEVSTNLSRNAFYNNVYRARRALYDNCIILEDGQYKLNSGAEFWFDWEEFHQLVREAEKQPGGSEKRASLLTQAIRLYRGSFLGELYAEWVDTIRLETEVQYLRSLARLAGSHVARGNHEAAICLLEELLALDNTDEAAHEQLITLLIKTSGLQDAQRQYNRYKDLMITELGVQPSKNFTELCREAGATR